MTEDRDYLRCFHCRRLRKASWFAKRNGCICGASWVRQPRHVEWYERILLLFGFI